MKTILQDGLRAHVPAPRDKRLLINLNAVLAVCLLFGVTLQAAPPGGYELTWSDEFDGVSMDTSKWGYRGLGARRDAVNTQDAISVTNGALTITTYTDSGTHYTGMIGTQGKFEQAFGYWEARMQLYDSPGMWSAYWIQAPGMGNPVGDPATAGVEIDVIEHRKVNGSNANIQDTAAHGLHWDGYGADHKSSGHSVTVAGLADTWHTYARLWTDQGYTFYIDGNPVWTINQAISKRTQYNILSAEVEDAFWAGTIPGGGYGDRASSTTKINIDYVRVYALPLVLSIEAASIREDAGSTTATVTRPYATGSSLTVTLSNNDPGEISVPNEVVIPANQSSAVFTVSAVDDAIDDGTQNVIITASSANYSPGIDAIDVIHSDPRLALPFADDFNALVAGDLDGQNGWTGTGAAVQTQEVYEGVHAVGIDGAQSEASHLFEEGRMNVWTDLRWRPVFGVPANDPPEGSTFAFYVNTNGVVVAFDGSTPRTLENTLVSSNTWARVTVQSDHANTNWNLWVNGVSAATGLGFYSAGSGSYRELVVNGSTAGTTYMDKVSIGLSNPLSKPQGSAAGTVCYGR